MKRLALVALLFFTAGTASALPFAKLLPKHDGSCVAACADLSHSPAVSGVDNTGNPYYFCVSNHANQGERGGFQTLPFFKGCYIGFNGASTLGENVRCLCENPGQVQWIDNQPADGGSCVKTCRSNGLHAIKTDSGDLFACAANNADQGFRGGFNQEQAGTCSTAFGANEVQSTSFRCACQ